MPKVKLKIHSWLSQSFITDAGGYEETPISVPDGASVLEMINHLARDNEIFHNTIFDETKTIRSHIVTVLNGRVVNPYDPTDARLKDGDEVTLLPLIEGG
jgi:molybdopterin converting factor small subunit